VVRFVWTPANIAHVARHGITPEEVEAVFEAEDLSTGPAARHGRMDASGTISGRTLQVVFAWTAPDEIFVITAHLIDARRRRP
jgi:uncharacterized DUF497 family protein